MALTAAVLLARPQILSLVLRTHDVQAAAAELGVHHSTLYRWIRQLDLTEELRTAGVLWGEYPPERLAGLRNVVRVGAKRCSRKSEARCAPGTKMVG